MAVFSTEYFLLLCSHLKYLCCYSRDFPGVKVEYDTSQYGTPYVRTMNKAGVKAQSKVPSLADLVLSPSLGLWVHLNVCLALPLHC